jgi:hypothetical protein
MEDLRVKKENFQALYFHALPYCVFVFVQTDIFPCQFPSQIIQNPISTANGFEVYDRDVRSPVRPLRKETLKHLLSLIDISAMSSSV